MPISNSGSWVRGLAVVPVAAAIALTAMTRAGSGDCNNNGIPDAAEIAAGLIDDCNANGIPDPCEYAGVSAEGETAPFGEGSPLVVTIADAAWATSDLRLTISVRADLDAISEAVQAKVGDTIVATLWITGGQACPSGPQTQTVIVPMATVNAAIGANGGDLGISIQSVGPVGVKECSSSFASVAIDYVGDLAPSDCLGNGTWDGCDIAADPSRDCDGNNLIDLCEIDGDPALDCDGNGVLDACEADCNGNGVNDTCELAANPSLDCDGNGQIDVCEISAEPALDCDANGTLDTCDLSSNSDLDCDGNGVLDACEADCDGNGKTDACDIAANPRLDCDGDGLIDSCEIAADPSLDCSGNGVLNTCELASAALGTGCDVDCDDNGVHDSCQINADPALDKNDDGLLDACQYALGDLTLDGVIDGADLAFMLGLWGTVNSPIGDLNMDGLIDGADLAQLLGDWGARQFLPDCWGTVLEATPDPAVIASSEWRDRITATGLPWRVRDNASGIEMLLIPPGTFMMGCSPSDQYGCFSDESPVHEVTLTQPFYLGRYEVTQSQWTAVMGSNPSSFRIPSSQVPAAQVPNRPVERVSWNMVQDFEAATGLRLPTEAEWEYACRAGTETAFNLPPNGTNDDSLLGQVAWFSSNSAAQTWPVGQKQANNLGLHDLHGNVWEWVEDWSCGYSATPQVDPTGPISGTTRVLRGGSWYFNSYVGRTSSRGGGGPDFGVNFVGFRAARTP